MPLFALVTNDNTVENVIVASQSVADAHLQSNGGSYPYVVNVDNADPQPSAGWVYDPQTQEFSPPPIDYVQILRSQIGILHTLLEEIRTSVNALDSSDVNEAKNQAYADLSNILSTSEQDQIDSIITWADEEE